MTEDKKDRKRVKLEEIEGKAVSHVGSNDQPEDHYPAGSPADIPDGAPICRIHGCPFVNGRCPKCPPLF